MRERERERRAESGFTELHCLVGRASSLCGVEFCALLRSPLCVVGVSCTGRCDVAERKRRIGREQKFFAAILELMIDETAVGVRLLTYYVDAVL